MKTTTLAPRIGAQIHADKASLLRGDHAAEIRALLEARGVLLIRGLDFSDEEQLEFTRTLGTLSESELYTVSLDKNVNPRFAEYNRLGNFSWHLDRTDLDVPPLCSMLRAERISPSGGETQFASTYAAYEDLPDGDKAALDSLRVVHLLESSFRESAPNPTPEQLAEWRTHPPKIHPLVWHHRSGRNSLAVSTSATEVVGMGREEGVALLRRLLVWATQPRYVYTHRWEVGDLVFWDNTGTLHKALAYAPDSGRCLRRTTLAGEEPVA